MGWLVVLLAIVVGVIMVGRGDAGTIAGFEFGQFAALTAGLVLLAYIGIPALRSYRGRLSQGVKDATVWAAFALVLVGIYSFRDEFSSFGRRIAGELLPPGSAINSASGTTGERAVRIRKRSDGHFAVHSLVNGSTLTLMVDTGASSVVLKNADARAIGINVSQLHFTIPVQTANGTTFAAPVTLRNVSVGDITLNRVEALVSKPGALKESLLGMSFLTRLRSYEFSGEFLTLRS